MSVSADAPAFTVATTSFTNATPHVEPRQVSTCLALILYVHFESVAAGIVESPGDCRWSGHHEMVLRKNADATSRLVSRAAERRMADPAYPGRFEALVARLTVG